MGGVLSMNYYKMIAGYNVVMGKQVISFWLLTVSVVANIVANLFLIPIWGIYGAGLASVISYAVCAVLFIVYFCRTTKIPFTNMLFINREEYRKLKARFLKKRKEPEEIPED